MLEEGYLRGGSDLFASFWQHSGSILAWVIVAKALSLVLSVGCMDENGRTFGNRRTVDAEARKVLLFGRGAAPHAIGHVLAHLLIWSTNLLCKVPLICCIGSDGMSVVRFGGVTLMSGERCMPTRSLRPTDSGDFARSILDVPRNLRPIWKSKLSCLPRQL